MKKRSIWQRIQAVICFLLLLCVFVPFGAVAISPGMVRDLIVLVDGQQVTGLAAAMDGVVPSMRVVYGVAAVIGLLCSLRMLTLVFARGGRDRSGVSLQNASDGPIHISVPAVETLVSQGIRDVPGLSDVRMKVHDYGDSVTIEIAMSARSDINIPETMMRLQSRIKAYVQESAGIEVREVRLNVEKVVLADGIQALPAGRGMKRVPASEQENSTPTLAAKPESAKPEAPKSAPPQPATAASTVEDDDDTDTDWNRKGWFGRFGHKKRETDADASVDASAAARAAQGDDAATVPSQAPETGDEISIKAHIAEYLTGEAPQAADGQPEPARNEDSHAAAETVEAAPEARVEAAETATETAVETAAEADTTVKAETGADAEPAADIETVAEPVNEAEAAFDAEPESEVAPAVDPEASAVIAVEAVSVEPGSESESTAEADVATEPVQVNDAEREPERKTGTDVAFDYDAVVADVESTEAPVEEPRTIVIGDTSESMVANGDSDDSDEAKAAGHNAGGQAIPL